MYHQDGLLCVSVVIKSANRHVRTDRPRDSTSDHHVTIGMVTQTCEIWLFDNYYYTCICNCISAFSSQQHDHLGMTGVMKYIYGYKCHSNAKNVKGRFRQHFNFFPKLDKVIF